MSHARPKVCSLWRKPPSIEAHASKTVVALLRPKWSSVVNLRINLRLLTKKDLCDTVERVDLENPLLQEEVDDLTLLLTTSMRDGSLHEQELLPESLSEDELRASSRDRLKQLLSFYKVPTSSSNTYSDGNILATRVCHSHQTESSEDQARNNEIVGTNLDLTSKSNAEPALTRT